MTFGRPSREQLVETAVCPPRPGHEDVVPLYGQSCVDTLSL